MVWELEMMNLRSFVVVSLVTRMSHKLIGRRRPNAVGCAQDPDYDEQCGSNAQNQSFFGGHTATSMTGAGLACAHHLHAGLYGARWADAVGCGGALAVATGVMVMRQRADRHWMSDNLVGATVGLAVGYGLPTLLDYHPFWQGDGAGSEAELPAAHRLRWDIVPLASEQVAGAAVVGLF
jgi:membrane-associated phospholipid phosphatase